MVAREEQLLSVTILTLFPTRSPVLRPLPPNGWFLPEVYPVWSPAKFFYSGSLWLLRQGIQITHIWKSHPCFPREITEHKYLVLESSHFLFTCPHRELLDKVVCKFASDWQQSLLQVFLNYWTPFSAERRKFKLILKTGKFYLDLSNCMQESLVPACCGSRLLHSPSSLTNSDINGPQLGSGEQPAPGCFTWWVYTDHSS